MIPLVLAGQRVYMNYELPVVSTKRTEEISWKLHCTNDTGITLTLYYDLVYAGKLVLGQCI